MSQSRASLTFRSSIQVFVRRCRTAASIRRCRSAASVRRRGGRSFVLNDEPEGAWLRGSPPSDEPDAATVLQIVNVDPASVVAEF
jgi:hypothetical protein